MYAPRMATHIMVDHLNGIEASYMEQPGPPPPIEVPTSWTIHTTYGTMYEYSIYHRGDKYRCFDFGGFLTAKDIENNLDIDVAIIPFILG